MNDEIKFKIIKSQQETQSFQKKTDQVQDKKIENIFKKTESPPQKLPKFLFIIPAFLIIISFVIYFFLFQKNKKQQLVQRQTEKEDIYQIFFSSPTEEINISTYTTDLSLSTFSEENQTSSDLAKDTISFATESISTSNLNQNQIFFVNPLATTSSQETTSSQFTTTSLSTTSKTTSDETILTKTTSTKSTTDFSTEPSSPAKNQPLDINVKEINNQSAGDELSYFDFSTLEVKVNELNDESLKNAWLSLIKIQKKAGEIYKIKILYNNEPVSSEIIKNYFFNPSFIEKKYSVNFLQGLGSDYYLLFYYTHTRKFPILIFRINNDLQVIPFMRLWDKESLLKDLRRTILFGLPNGNLIRNFTNTETYKGIDYKIAYFDNDYKLIWTIYKNYLVISTSLSAFKFIIEKM